MQKQTLNVGIFTYDFFPFIGGQGRHIYQMYQQNQIHKKTNMFVFSPNKNALPNHIQLFPETKNSRLKNIEYSWKLNTLLENLISQYKLDVMHLHGGPGGLFLLKKFPIPIVYTSHHTYWQQYRYIRTERWKYALYILEKQSYRHADQIICVSEDTQKILSKYYNVDHSSLHYIPNGIETKQDRTNQVENKTKDILYVGRIDKRKGVDFLIKAMMCVNNIDSDITLHVVGTGKDKIELEAWSKRYKLPVIFYDHIPDHALQQMYTKVAAQVVPSIFEGFGISVLEGMANHVPIIATNVDGIRGIVKNNYSGMLVPYNDPEALADTIIYLLANPHKQKELADNAYRELPKYNWQKNYFQTIQLYETISN